MKVRRVNGQYVVTEHEPDTTTHSAGFEGWPDSSPESVEEARHQMQILSEYLAWAD